MQISKIIIGIDDSKYARNAAASGFGLARKFGAHVGVVHVIEPVVTPLDTSDSLLNIPMANIGGPEEQNLINAKTDYSDQLIKRMVSDLSEGLEVTYLSQYGSTADGILQSAVEFGADLIVIGTHKRSGFDRFLMGDVAEGVVHRTTIPVLVVPFESGE
jgi:nucleotide-binding universal stress UspA family protein